MAAAQLAGEDFLVGLDRLRADAAGQQVTPVPGLATSTATGLARRLTARHWRGAEAGLAAATARMTGLLPAERAAELAEGPVTIDIDATDVEVYGSRKRGVAYTYQGQRAGRPHVAAWAETEIPLAADLLAGDQDPRSSVVALLRRALAALPQAVRDGAAAAGQKIALRADAGYFAGDLARAAAKADMAFAIGAKRITSMWKALAGIAEDAWRDAIDMAGAQVAVSPYHPADWPDSTVLLVRRVKLDPDQVSADPRSRRRRTLHPDQRALPIPELEQEPAIYAYSFICTNMDVSTPARAGACEHWYRHRTAIENIFRDSKHGAALRHLPSAYELRQFMLCYRHHPDYTGKKPTHELIQRLHAEHSELGAFALTEPEHGSDAVILEATPRRDGSEWVINGRKRWPGNAVWCDVIVVFARDRSMRRSQRTERQRFSRSAPGTAPGERPWSGEPACLSELRYQRRGGIPDDLAGVIDPAPHGSQSTRQGRQRNGYAGSGDMSARRTGGQVQAAGRALPGWANQVTEIVSPGWIRDKMPVKSSGELTACPFTVPLSVAEAPASTLADSGPRAGRPRRSLTLERFLQLTDDVIGRGIHSPLHHLVGTCECLVERLFNRRLAHRDQPCLAGGELPGQVMEFLARQGPAAEPLGDDTDARAIHPLDHVRFAVLLVDDGRIE